MKSIHQRGNASRHVEVEMKTGADESGISGDLSRQASAWLVRLEDAPENDVLRAQFLDWVATSHAHQAAWEETARVSDLIAAAGPLPWGKPFLPTSSARRGWFAPARAFASLAAAVCIAWIAVPYGAVMLRADAITGIGELRQVKLQDGSIAQLAPGTAIAFNNDAGGRRLSLLQGEAWFDVAHDKARPFKVIAGEDTVTVLGTAFSVRKTDSGAEVAVQRGHVVVAAKGAHSARADLLAGESALVDGDAVTRGTIRPDRVASWREGVAIIDARPVGDVIDRIRPWYRGYISARGPGLTSRHVSGVYDLRDPDLALEALARAHQITVSRVSPWLRIVTVQ
ncbi:FecR domain-containing protein [Novosphingobium sp. SG707]|uniref:FecR family protein n=1 Tax=Novosphingobium sp. SG707 TaxID=2586996 RepID=UPI001FF091D3|nr:FecR domain-containing protein [Novosphingobium sp. SG707]